jgi:hypothetical protein
MPRRCPWAAGEVRDRSHPNSRRWSSSHSALEGSNLAFPCRLLALLDLGQALGDMRVVLDTRLRQFGLRLLGSGSGAFQIGDRVALASARMVTNDLT